MAKETGTDTEAGQIVYYDPAKGGYATREWSADDPFAHKQDFEWTMVDGVRTYTLKDPDAEFKNVPVGDNHFDKVYAGTPGFEDIPDFGWGEEGRPDYYNPWGGMNRDNPLPEDNQQGYTPVDLTPGYSPGDRPTDPFVPEPDGGWDFDPDRSTGGGRGPDWTGGGGQPDLGIDPGEMPTGGLDDLKAPLMGFDSSSNKDFYQQQFAGLRDQQTVNQLRRYASAIRAEELAAEREGAEPFGGDPWSWAGGEESFTPQMGTGGPSRVATGDFALNPQFQNANTGTDILAQITPTLSDAERVYINKNKDYFNDLDLSQGYEGVQDWLADNPNPNDRGWTATLGKVASAIYQPVYENLGPQAPVGYAAPI